MVKSRGGFVSEDLCRAAELRDGFYLSRYFTCEQMEDALSFEEDETAFRWSCDKCGLAVEFPPTNFSGAWAELRMRGWQASKERVEGEWPVWSHRCGKCRKSAASILDQPFRLVK